MTADEMFRNLGYTKIFDEGLITYQAQDERTITVCLGIDVVGSKIKGKIRVMTFDEIKAVNKLLEERNL